MAQSSASDSRHLLSVPPHQISKEIPTRHHPPPSMSWSSLLSSWKGIAFSAFGSGVVAVLMCVLIRRRFSRSQRPVTDDILTEIMARLPVKSLLRFKSVSTHWRSLISSPYFCHRFYPDPFLVSSLLFDRSDPVHRGCDFVSLSDNPTSPPFDETLTFMDDDMRILQSCHGLLLLCPQYTYSEPYCIYNPTTLQFRSLFLPSGQDLGVFDMN
ncbi:hypothetical protein LWI29_024942 [Acer saccharum]|uniref:F-box domain-containing protein n=1 Tax=Acer saccharum TaxID=4024 RepID=A0AA39SHT7_ACESA|nr:hypothetical protein LWI29_024942 [Acer saccharum]